MLTDKKIKDLKQEIDDLRPCHPDEDETCERLIVPTLCWLGWDEDMVEEQYYIPGLQNGKNGYVDYALLDENGNPAVFVEAKALDNLGFGGVIQLQQYWLKHVINGGKRKLDFLVLTDGNIWQFHSFNMAISKSWCYPLNLEKGDTSKIKDELKNLLDCQRVLSGESSKYLSKIYFSSMA